MTKHVMFSVCWVVCVLRVVNAHTSNSFYAESLETEDVALSLLTEKNEELPDECRTDMCGEHRIDSPRKGIFDWHRVPVETRVYMQCPHQALPAATPLYAVRDCLMADGLDGKFWKWSTANMSDCPDPPFTEKLENLSQESIIEIEGKRQGPLWYNTGLFAIRAIMQETETVTVFDSDVIHWERFLEGMRQAYLTSSRHMSLRVLRDVIEVTSAVIDPIKSDFIRVDVVTKEKLLDDLIEIVHLANDRSLESGGNAAILTANIIVQLEKVETPIAGFQHALSDRENFRADGDVGGTATESPSWGIPPMNLTLPQFAADEGSDYHLVRLIALRYSSTVLGRQFQYTTSDVGTTEPQPVGPLVYVTVEADGGSTTLPATVDVVLAPSHGRAIPIIADGAQCTYIPVDVRTDARGFTSVDVELTQRSNESCQKTSTSGDHVTCHCQTTGFFSLAAPINWNDMTMEWGSGNREDDDSITLDTFLGFPYSHELYIVGHVLRALSLLGLLATLLSFALFRKVGRGVPTLILVQLCVALVCLLLVLYIAEGVATDRRGCRAANILRYYLVMVSLLWNAVEAVNMYLMLVQVFNSEVSHFILKSATVAWGLPICMVGLAAGVKITAFDGYYENCQFRCGLATDMLYWGYLLPMLLIMFCNMVVFALVFKVINRHQQAINTADARRSRVMQLVGAVAMLVLLGVPWIFSAFGAISTTDTDLALLEGIFQVIFVVFVNLQGIFIFLFHCVRNQEVRQHWKVFVSSGFSTSDTSMELKSSSRRSRNKS